MAITRSTTPTMLREGIHDFYGMGYNDYPKAYKQAFDMEKSDGEVERYQEVGGFGLHIEKSEGSDTSLSNISEGPTTIIENKAYALGYHISHEALSDNKYQRVLSEIKDLGKSAGQTEETIAINRLNTAFSTATADLLANGQAMCSTAQPILGGGTVQNRPTTGASLSEASLIVDVENIRNFKDSGGLRINANPEMLIVPVAKEVQAQKLLQSDLTVGSGNNDINVFGRNRGFFPKGFISSPYISNSDYYFIRTSVRGLVFQERESARIMEDVLQRSMQREVISYMRFGVGCSDFRSIYGNPGS